MTNYYEELGFYQEMSIEEINEKLYQLRNVWNQRLMNEPEKASQMLNTISTAMEIFASQETRLEYDKKLITENQYSEANEVFKSYYEQALSFYNAKEYDLAKASIDKALSSMQPEDETSEVFVNVSDIYSANKLFDDAINYINKAIICDAQDGKLFLLKGTLYQKIVDDKVKQNIDRISKGQEVFEIDKNYFEMESKCFDSAMKLAHEKGDVELEGNAAGYLAFSMFRCQNPDLDKVKLIAETAVSLGDISGNGESTLYEIENLQKQQKAEQERNSIIQMMINEKIKSSNEYIVEYHLKYYYDFGSTRTEGEQIGTQFWYCVLEAMEECGIRFYDRNRAGGIYRTFQENGDYSKYKYQGFIMYLCENGLLCGVENGVQVYLTADNKFIIDFKRSQLYEGVSNNRIVLKVTEKAIREMLIDENAVIIPKDEYERDKREADTKAMRAELDTQEQEITSKYSDIRDKLKADRDKKIEELRSNADNNIKYKSIQDKARELKIEKESLGFFSSKRKKEIDSEIERLEKQLEAIPSEEKIISDFQQKISEVNNQENNEKNKVRTELKKNYPYAQF